MLSGKYILPFSVAAIVLVIGGAFVFSQMNQNPEPQATPNPSPSPTPTPTPQIITVPEIPKDWQVYRNDELGFEVKYPFGWAVSDDGGRFYNVALEQTVKALMRKCQENEYALAECDVPYFVDPSFTVSRFNNRQDLDLLEFYEKSIDSYPQNKPQQTVQFGSFEIVRDHDWTRKGTEYVFFLNPSREFGILVRNEIGDNELFNQFLASFEFIEK